MIVAIITEEKALEIQDTEYKKGIKYNPRKAPDNRYFITVLEAENLDSEDVLDLVEYESLGFNYENTED